MDAAHKILKERLKGMGRVAVALSGGLDSSVLLAVCARELGAENCLALTAVTPYMMSREVSDARKLAAELGVRLVEIEEGIPEELADNPPPRCYICKKILFGKILRAAGEAGFENVADGGNADDISDHRPGVRAVRELGVQSPFQDCGMGKAQIRALARAHNLEVAQKPAYACLLTRLEHGARADAEVLARIDAAECALRDMGFEQVRVRVHGGCARVEVPAERLVELFERRAQVAFLLKSAGFRHAALDMGGYERGAMNEDGASASKQHRL